MKEIWDLWDNIKWGNLHRIGIPGEEKEKWIENIFEKIMAVNFTELKGNWYQIKGNIEDPKQVESKQAHTKTYYNKKANVKDKERLIEAAKEKQSVNYKVATIRLSADCSIETPHAWRE